MPKKCENLGLSFLYPDNWSSEEDNESQAVTVESPEGAFLSLTRIDSDDLQAPIKQATEAMEAEYDEIEHEPLEKEVASLAHAGVTQRFVYLDLIVTSHLVSIAGNGVTYLVQMQAEDRDMNRLDQVFDAMLMSICQSIIGAQSS